MAKRPRAKVAPPKSVPPARDERRGLPRASGRQLSKRPQSDVPLLYGRHPIAEALQARPQALRKLYLAPQHLQPQSDWAPLLALARTAGVAVEACERPALEALVGDVVHQGAVAKMAPFAYAALRDTLVPAEGQSAALIVVLDQVQDPHNLGALVRSAVALGASGVVIATDRSAEMTPVAIKASAGAAFHLPIAQVVNVRRALTELQAAGVWCCALAAEGETSVHAVDWKRPMAVVVGAEGTGVRPLVAKACDWRVRIPIARIGSLNASVAGAIALFAAAQTRAT